MIPVGVQVFVALEPVDLRSGFERLSGLALQHTGYDADRMPARKRSRSRRSVVHREVP